VRWCVLFVVLCAFCNSHLFAQDAFLQEYFSSVSIPAEQDIIIRDNYKSASLYIAGYELLAQGKHRESIAYFKQSGELDKYSPAPWKGIAIALSAIGRDAAVIAAWKEVLKRDPLHSDALLIVGLDQVKSGNFFEAERNLSTHWLNYDTNSLESILRLAGLLTLNVHNKEVYEALRNTSEKAIAEAKASLVSKATGPAWRGFLQQLVDLGGAKLAMELIAATAIELEQEQLGAVLTILPLLESAIGGNGEVTRQTYVSISKEQDLLPLAPRWFEPVPLHEALSIAAQSMSIIQPSSVAPILLYAASLELEPFNVIALNNLAWSLLNNEGPIDQVQDISLAALDLAPEASFVLDTVGRMYTMMGDSNKGIQYLLQSLSARERPSAETLDHLGDAYWISGDRAAAVQAWQSSLEILLSEEYIQEALDGYRGMAQSVWGISVFSPEALYDFELGELTRRLKNKLMAINKGKTPNLGFRNIRNGAE